MTHVPPCFIRPFIQPATGNEALIPLPTHRTLSDLEFTSQEWAAALSLLTSLLALLLMLLLPGRRQVG